MGRENDDNITRPLELVKTWFVKYSITSEATKQRTKLYPP